MCTAVRFVDKQGNFYFGRNLDWGCGFGEQVCIVPRNHPWKSAFSGDMTTKGAIVGSAVVMPTDEIPPLFFDCANEDGLAVGGLSFAGYAKYSDGPVDGKTNVATYELPLWILTQFTTVDEVEEVTKNMNLVAVKIGGMDPTPMHWIVTDKERSIVIEQTEANGFKVYHNDFDVLTNQPTFDWHVQNLRNYINVDHDWHKPVTWTRGELAPYGVGPQMLGLPGDCGAVARFVRAAYINAMSPVFGEDDPGKNANENIMRLFHTLSNVAMVKGMGAMADGSYEYTIYTGGYASGVKTYFWNTYEDPTLNSVTITEEIATADKIQTFSPKNPDDWGRQAFASDVSQ